jgi:tetratricopeptide (TPR) repeat protein
MIHSLPEAADLFDPAAAARAFDEAHRINPEESGPLIRAGEARLAAGDLDGAERALYEAWRMNDRATSALFLSGYLAWKRGDDDAARALLQRAAGTVEKQAPVHGVLGEGDTRTGDMEEVRRRAASRRLFAACQDGLDASGADPGRLFAAVDEYLASLPRGDR